MIKVKHFMEPVEADDGQRMWVEPFGLTSDLREWCQVHWLPAQFSPPKELWEWFAEHPAGYDYFRGQYHEVLANSPCRPALQQLACTAMHENITLLHGGDDCQHNSATALYEFLCELEAYCPKDWEK